MLTQLAGISYENNHQEETGDSKIARGEKISKSPELGLKKENLVFVGGGFPALRMRSGMPVERIKPKGSAQVGSIVASRPMLDTFRFSVQWSN